MSRTRTRSNDNIPGLTAAWTSPFIIIAVGVVVAWVMWNGWLNTTWALVLGGIMGVALLAAQVPLFRNLIGSSISRPGCLGGLYTYGVMLVVWAILFWQGGLNGALLGVLLVPACCFGVAAFVTAREPSSRRRHKK